MHPRPTTDGVAATIREDVELGREIERRAERISPEPSVSVSDLLGLRRAYWRRRAPGTSIAEDRRDRMQSGRAVHARLPAALPREGAYEVRVRREGIVGRIDLLSDVPVEVKTGSAVGAARFAEARPDHVEQIAMYCALVGGAAGRVVTLGPADDAAPSVEAIEIDVADPAGILAAMRARARSLRNAFAVGRPIGLPPCRWFGRRCEFQEARVCDCDGSEPEGEDGLRSAARAVRPRDDIAERWRAALAGAPVPSDDPGEPRRPELLFPRRAYFDRVRPVPDPSAGAPAARSESKDLYDWLAEAVESGPVGEIARLAPSPRAADDEVAGFRGLPYLVKTSRAGRRLRPEEVSGRFPHYLVDLALRCAATDTRSGRIFVAFERAEREADRYQVLEVGFDASVDLDREYRRRSDALRDALAAQRPDRLAPCPGWKEEGCPYRPDCGCAAAAAGRSQR